MGKMMMMLQREVKRVPMDFDYPRNKTWAGYLISCWTDCYDLETSKQCDYCQKNKSIEPPTGEGYQCWETVSEGSPISPVFETFDDLCQWLSVNAGGICEDFTKQDWIDALEDSCPLLNLETKSLERKTK